MAGLALAVVVYLLTLEDAGWVPIANRAIRAIFLVDYVVRLWLAPDKRKPVHGDSERADIPSDQA